MSRYGDEIHRTLPGWKPRHQRRIKHPITARFKPSAGTTFHLGWESATVLQDERRGSDSKDTGHCNLQTSNANNFSSSLPPYPGTSGAIPRQPTSIDPSITKRTPIPSRARYHPIVLHSTCAREMSPALLCSTHIFSSRQTHPPPLNGPPTMTPDVPITQPAIHSPPLNRLYIRALASNQHSTDSSCACDTCICTCTHRSSSRPLSPRQ
jgi:hypothetical protein